MDIQGMLNEIENALKSEGKEQKRLLDQTISTFEGDKPTFKPVIDMNDGGNATVATHPSGNQKGVEKWGYLNEGTKIRWALMSSDWKSKTKAKRFKSGKGAGKVIIVGKRAMQRRNIKPRPGIKERGWTKEYVVKRKVIFATNVAKSIRKAAKRIF